MFCSSTEPQSPQVPQFNACKTQSSPTDKTQVDIGAIKKDATFPEYQIPQMYPRNGSSVTLFSHISRFKLRSSLTVNIPALLTHKWP